MIKTKSNKNPMNISANRILYGKKSIIDSSSIKNASIEAIKVALKNLKVFLPFIFPSYF